VAVLREEIGVSSYFVESEMFEGEMFEGVRGFAGEGRS
jgi:hypothetical protein